MQRFVKVFDQRKEALLILNDKILKKLAYSHLFPTGEYDYQVERNTKITPSRYFNQRLPHCSKKLASDSDYIFFAHSITQRIQLNNEINIAMKKVASNTLTAGILSKNFKETVR